MKILSTGLFSLALATAVLCAAPARAGELIDLPSRANVTQGIYLDAPAQAQPGWVLLLFAGNDGALALSGAGATKKGNNFVVRTAPYWRNAGDATALFDTPSDHAGGVQDDFRLGPDAVRDVAAAVTELRGRYPNARVALLGASRGTVTVGNVLKRNPVLADAYILTSPVTQAKGSQLALSGLNWPGNKARVLVVSNEHDGCAVSPFDAASRMAADNGFDFIAMSSSTSQGLSAKAQCGPNSPHGFLGIETRTLDAIRGWLEKL